MSNSPLDDKDDGPWYKQFWAWFILAPLIIIMIVWIPFLTIVVKNADDTVIDNYYKEGRMINQRVDQDRQAKALGLAGELFLDLDVGDILLTLTSTDAAYQLPQEVLLHLDHPVEADNDLSIRLRQTTPGRYQAELQQRIQNRWYIRLLPPVKNAEEVGSSHPDKIKNLAGGVWRITGDMDLSKGSRLLFGGDE
ncbi:MAG: FixH family protein [Cellvibrionaceae bacterium]